MTLECELVKFRSLVGARHLDHVHGALSVVFTSTYAWEFGSSDQSCIQIVSRRTNLQGRTGLQETSEVTGTWYFRFYLCSESSQCDQPPLPVLYPNPFCFPDNRFPFSVCYTIFPLDSQKYQRFWGARCNHDEVLLDDFGVIMGGI
jgi:hypothetical protein